jgi:hypothetical protein
MIFDENSGLGIDATATMRKTARLPISLPVALTTPGSEVLAATLTDISTGGCRVRSTYAAALGRFLTIDIPLFASYSGWVAWENGMEFGLALSNAIPTGVVHHVLSISQIRSEMDAIWFRSFLARPDPMYLSFHARPIA